jgi:23S rRNA pseudoU1915 N3-methylase RlmH
VITKFVDDVVDEDDKARKELGCAENLGFEEIPEEQTEEEAAAMVADIQNKKAEAAKKTKSKPKTEEEEAEELNQLIAKTAQNLGLLLSGSNDSDSDMVKAAEKEIELVKTRWLMQNHIKMDAEQYDNINRKLSIYDIELGARDIILRLDLDIALSKFTEPTKALDGIVSVKSLEQPAASVGRDSKINAKKSELDSVVSGNPVGTEEE